MKMNEKDLIILSHLRQNARQNLTAISRKTGIPVTTIYDRVKLQEKKIIKKYTSLINFSEIGFNCIAKIALKVENNQRVQLKKFLLEHENVNSLYVINYEYDFLAEMIFKTIKDAEIFIEKLDSKFNILSKKIFYVIDEIKKENFLVNNFKNEDR